MRDRGRAASTRRHPAPTTSFVLDAAPAPICALRRRRCCPAPRRAGPEPHAGVQHRVLDDGAVGDRQSSAEHRVRARPRRLGRPHSRSPTSTGGTSVRAGCDPAAPTREPPVAQRSPTTVWTRAVEDVAGRLQVALGRPDVEPVALAREAVQAGADQLGNTSRSNDTVSPAARSVEHLALEHVGAGVDVVGVDLVRALGFSRNSSTRRRRRSAPARRRTGPRPRSGRSSPPRRAARGSAAGAVRSKSARMSPFRTAKRSSSRPSACLTAPAVPSGSSSST